MNNIEMRWIWKDKVFTDPTNDIQYATKDKILQYRQVSSGLGNDIAHGWIDVPEVKE